MKIRKEFINFLMIAVGAVIAAFSIEDFLAPNDIFDGGIVGVSMIVSSFSNPLGCDHVASPLF